MIFNRFTREVRRCVDQAIVEARFLGHDSVGDEDLLLGILGTDTGVAREALESLGVSREAVREESERIFVDTLATIGISLDEVRDRLGVSFRAPLAAATRLPFSPRAKRALEQALREAVRRRDSSITAEHVLLGILRDERGASFRILANLGVSAEAVCDRVQSLSESRP